VTPRIVHSRELHMYEFSAETLACCLIWEVDTTRIVYYGDSNFGKNPPAFKGTLKQKIDYAC
jgi:hypothetical protein